MIRTMRTEPSYPPRQGFLFLLLLLSADVHGPSLDQIAYRPPSRKPHPQTVAPHRCSPATRGYHGIFTSQELGPLRRRSTRFPPPHVDQLMLVCSCHMSRCAGPSVVSGTCHHSRSHRVSLHIRQSYPQMPTAQTTCKKAILPEMSCAAATHVVILRISSMYSPEQNSQRIFSTGHRYQMHMVAHHAPAQQSHFGVA